MTVGLALAIAGAGPAAAALPSDLSTLPSTRFVGWWAPPTLPGYAPTVENAGYATAGECDLDDDGRKDFVIGAPIGDSPIDLAATAAGRVYVRFGAEHENLATGTLRIEGEPIKNGRAGVVVACGDVSGDGIDDLVIAASQIPRVSPAGANAGRLYVVFGASGLAGRGTMRLDQLGSQGYVIVGPAANALLGAPNAVGGGLDVGDVDGDGRAEILVTAKASHLGRSGGGGTGYVIDGQSTTDPVDLAVNPSQVRLRLDGGNHSVTLDGGVAASAVGNLYTIAAVGDVTGDGTTDIAVGETFRRRGGDGASPGAVSVISGAETGTIDMQTAAPDERPDGVSFVVWGVSPVAAGARSTGGGIAPAGDVNGDGKADIAIATASRQPTQVAIVFGSDSSARVELDELGDRGYTITGPLPTEANTDDFGVAMINVGDVNGDDRPDLMIGAPRFSGLAGKKDTGAAYLVYGQDGPQTIDSGSMTADQGAHLYGDDASTFLGRSLSRAGVDPATGKPRVLIGAASLTTRGNGNYARLITLSAPAAEDPGEPPAAEQAEVDWGFRESFRRYVNGGWSTLSTHVPIVAGDGARCNPHPNPLVGGCDPKPRQMLTDPPPTGALWFTPTGLEYDVEAGTGRVSTRGTVTFDFPGHFFRLMIQDPTFAIADGKVIVSARVKLDIDPLFGQYPSVDQQMIVGELPLVGAPTVTDKLITWQTAGGTLRPEAAEALGNFLAAGAELDPAKITAPLALGPPIDPPVVEVPLDPASPSTTVTSGATPATPTGVAVRAPARIVRTKGTTRGRKAAKRRVAIQLGSAPTAGSRATHRVWLTRRGRIVARGDLRGRTLRVSVTKTRRTVARRNGRRVVVPAAYPRLRGDYVVRPTSDRAGWTRFTVRVR